MSAEPDAPADLPEPTPAAPPSPAPPHWKRVYAHALAAAFVSALAALMVGEAVKDFFRPAVLPALSDPFSNANDRLILAGKSKEAITAFEAFGAFLGLAFGLAGAMAKRKPLREWIAPGLIGFLLGLSVAAVATKILMPVADANRGQMVDDMILPIWVLGGMWAPLGLVAGLAFALGLWPVERSVLPRAALGGLVGAAVGTVLYLLIGALLMPLSETGSPLPATLAARSLARLVVALATGLVVAGIVNGGREKKASSKEL